ncbi:early nodulin-like protein 7 [Nicotiana tabacum]|uniref:Mavicyanin n=1 Tax=Nicotiana tabacum TaxID=4097 RepID=Q8H0I2_TOBAC|nr:mavicyanin-like [Nicotiana tomentosiformis]XP_016470525.1 PREDICTED: mavicyanin-like [Nicotiana tabacum]BAC53926.1 NtEPc-like protein [Nicotiana tabacum]
MASIKSTTICFVTALFISLTISSVVAASGEEFKVGDAVGWRQPSVNETDLYHHWASKKKFHVGDSLRFEYKNDSVVVVDKWEFYHCNRTHPTSGAKDGNTTVNLDRAGPFYFVSGDPEHCKNGQRLAIEVLPLYPISQSPPQPISLAPSPSPLSSSALVSSVPLIFISVPLMVAVIVFV